MQDDSASLLAVHVLIVVDVAADCTVTLHDGCEANRVTARKAIEHGLLCRIPHHSTQLQKNKLKEPFKCTEEKLKHLK
jgi:hypothetical protein